jgi:hypothetical protein
VRLSASLLSDPSVAALAETFKVLGDTTRVRILDVLSRTELCVQDLAINCACFGPAGSCGRAATGARSSTPSTTITSSGCSGRDWSTFRNYEISDCRFQRLPISDFRFLTNLQSEICNLQSQRQVDGLRCL